MKSLKITFAALVLICSTLSASAVQHNSKADLPKKVSIKKIIYQFSDAYITIDYNPGNGAVSGVYYDGSSYAVDWDSSGSGISYNSTTRKITLTNYQVKLTNDQGWISLNGIYDRL